MSLDVEVSVDAPLDGPRRRETVPNRSFLRQRFRV
jgi:hypothetical protein